MRQRSIGHKALRLVLLALFAPVAVSLASYSSADAIPAVTARLCKTYSHYDGASGGSMYEISAHFSNFTFEEGTHRMKTRDADKGRLRQGVSRTSIVNKTLTERLYTYSSTGEAFASLYADGNYVSTGWDKVGDLPSCGSA